MRDSDSAEVNSDIAFGINGDVSLGGDYDGVGLSDLAVWRPSPTPGESRFIVRRSVNDEIWEIPGGRAPTPATSDYPVAASRVR